MVPKILFLKNSISQLSNAVSTVPIALLDQKLQPEEKKSDFKTYFYFREICKVSLILRRIYQNLYMFMFLAIVYPHVTFKWAYT